METRRSEFKSNKFWNIQLPRDTRKVNAWGENHLWVRYRKESNLSGLVESRIPAPSGRGVSIQTVLDRTPIYSHVWQPGDIIFWDNSQVMHRGTPYDPTKHQRIALRLGIVDNT